MNRQRGQAIILMAFGMIMMLAIAGLSIDGGRAYLDRRQMQNAADASALAGAIYLAQHPFTDPTNVAGVGVKATAIANRWPNVPSSTIIMQPVDKSSVLVKSGLWTDPSTRGVRVTLIEQQITYFMPIFGISHYTIKATATSTSLNETFSGQGLPTAPGCPSEGVRPMALNPFSQTNEVTVAAIADKKFPTGALPWDMVNATPIKSGSGNDWKCGDAPVAVGTLYPASPNDDGTNAVAAVKSQGPPFIAAVIIQDTAFTPANDGVVTVDQIWLVSIDSETDSNKSMTLHFLSVYPTVRLTQ